jgi:hypothetical protein
MIRFHFILMISLSIHFISCANSDPRYQLINSSDLRINSDMMNSIDMLTQIPINQAGLDLDLSSMNDADLSIADIIDIGRSDMLNTSLMLDMSVSTDLGNNYSSDMAETNFSDMEVNVIPLPEDHWGLVDFPWFFSIHSFEVQSNLNTSLIAFNKILALGGEGVRTDIFWKEIEPTRGITDTDQVAFYQNYFRIAAEINVKPLVIFSNPPEWAIQLYRSGNKEEFWIAYESYVRLATIMVKEYTEHYQLWNEANHIIDIINEDDDWELIYRAGVIVRSLDPTAMLSVNVMANVLGWEESVTRWVQNAGEYIDVIGIDHYPGTWAGFNYTDWTPVETLIRRINDESDLWYGKYGAVMETGFSSWILGFADESSQRTWINQSLTQLRTIISQANQVNEYKVLFANYYQLIDVDTDGIGQEAHFGILHSDFTPKVGFNDLRLQIEQFDE